MTAPRRIGPVLVVLALLAAWEIFTAAGFVDALLVASPLDVAREFGSEPGLLLSNAWITTREALFGLALAILGGIVIGTALHLYRPFRDVTLPLLIGSQAVPMVVLAPLLVIAFGYGIMPKVLIVALACFFPIAIGTFDGLRTADSALLKLMRSFGAGRLRTLRLAEAPAALPRMLGGVRVAASWAYVGAVFGEYAGSSEGLGHLIARGAPSFETARVYAAVILLTIASLALYKLVTIVERRAVPWANRQMIG